jgi:hypothetical protein
MDVYESDWVVSSVTVDAPPATDTVVVEVTVQPITGTKFGVIVETAASSVSKTRVTRSRNIGTLVLALIAGCYDYLVCVWVPEKRGEKWCREECGICTVGYYCTNGLLVICHVGFMFVSGHMVEFKELGRPY